jgi:hypothetical protein
MPVTSFVMALSVTSARVIPSLDGAAMAKGMRLPLVISGKMLGLLMDLFRLLSQMAQLILVGTGLVILWELLVMLVRPRLVLLVVKIVKRLLAMSLSVPLEHVLALRINIVAIITTGFVTTLLVAHVSGLEMVVRTLIVLMTMTVPQLVVKQGHLGSMEMLVLATLFLLR